MSTESSQNGPGVTENPATDGYTPFRIDTSKPPVDAERIPLFYIDDREYTGPKQIPGGLALQALQVTVHQGRAAGAYFCMEEAIGKEAVDDLLNCKQLTYEQARDFLTQISAMYYGQAMELTGK